MNSLSTDELILALRNYDLDLRWIASSAVWQVTLPDWKFLHTEARDHREALRLAYALLQEEQAAE